MFSFESQHLFHHLFESLKQIEYNSQILNSKYQEEIFTINCQQTRMSQFLMEQEKKVKLLKKQIQQTGLGRDLMRYIRCNSFMYQLELKSVFELPKYRNRGFSIRMSLMKNGIFTKNSNKILVELQVWTYDQEPKQITKNNKGQQIYKGSLQGYLKNGVCQIKNLSICEVSSHFYRGAFMFVIIPVDDFSVEQNETIKQIKINQIKPLVLQEVVVKAKKFTDKHIPYYLFNDGTLMGTPPSTEQL